MANQTRDHRALVAGHEHRFWSKVDVRSDRECWPWRGFVKRYGQFSIRYSDDSIEALYAHRVAYELLVGPVPDGLELDHLCHNRPCCNPAHLEAVTHEENMRRQRGAYPLDTILGEYRAGERVPEIAARFGISTSLIYKRAKEAGISRPPGGAGSKAIREARASRVDA